ncbi:hypothetical protein [Oceanirhabdus sp. W0125-5]|uniref:hypothetical protein n=1 Tax=Oceanirhabdus sp. W0125-5 TaxID=2999116 RepID=UPI0022F3361D|nr:hypothetical protein [Oceanirhabdus sp. W0125-5]WBW98160.1 hypothetical protein OW730_05180 [Oceanirhabdus sp. W0125-5]
MTKKEVSKGLSVLGYLLTAKSVIDDIGYSEYELEYVIDYVFGHSLSAESKEGGNN